MDDDVKALIGEFPELSNEDVLPIKEVYAHFGLLFVAFANLEAGLQNCYVFWKLRGSVLDGKVTSLQDWEVLHTEFEDRAIASTLGSLLNLLRDCEGLSGVMSELKLLKESRDYFAHHFFREENDKMFADEVMLKLMARMHILRCRVKDCETSVDGVGREMFQSLYPDTDISARVEEYTEELMDGILNRPPSRFGWEQ